MAEYQVLYWRDIPSMVVVRGGGREVQGRMRQRYQEAIDEAAMAMDATSGDAYLDGWTWGTVERREGALEDILQSLLAELERSHPLASAGDAFTE